MITYLGSCTVGAVIPYTMTVSGSLAGVIGYLGKQLASAQLSANFSVPSPASLLKLKANAAAVLDVAIDWSKFAVNISANAQAQIGILKSMIASLNALIGGPMMTGGIGLYSYHGPVSTMGAEIQGATSSGLPDGSAPSAVADALVIVTTNSAAWKAISYFMKVS